MDPHLAYWLIVAAPVLAVALLSLWPAFRRAYRHDARHWLPAMLLGAAVLAVDGVVSAAAGFWEFTDERFAPQRYLGLPAAEYPFFFASAVAGVRLLWVAADRVPGILPRRPVLVGWVLVGLAGVTYGLVHHDRLRTVYVCALVLPLAIGLAMSTEQWYTRATQVYLALGFALFLPMDILMNAIGSFAHDDATKTAVELPGGTPVEDLPYIVVVLVLLRFLPVLTRRGSLEAAR